MVTTVSSRINKNTYFTTLKISISNAYDLCHYDLRLSFKISFPLSISCTCRLRNLKNPPVSKIKFIEKDWNKRKKANGGMNRLNVVNGLLICSTKTFLIHNIDRIEPPAAVDSNFHICSTRANASS